MFSGCDVRFWYFVIIIYNYVVYIYCISVCMSCWLLQYLRFGIFMFKCLMNYRQFLVCSFVQCRFYDNCKLTCNRAQFLLQIMSLISHQWDNNVVLNYNLYTSPNPSFHTSKCTWSNFKCNKNVWFCNKTEQIHTSLVHITCYQDCT